MNQKDLMKQLQKKNILVCVEELREYLSDDKTYDRWSHPYKYIRGQLENIENLVESYDGDFEKKPLLSRIQHAKSTVHYGEHVTKNQGMIILMILDEIKIIIHNDNSSPEE